MIRALLRERAARRAEQAEVEAIYERVVLDDAQAKLDYWLAEQLEERRRWYTKARAPREECVRGVLAAVTLAADEIGVPPPALVWFEDEDDRRRGHRQRWGAFDTGAFSVTIGCERHSTIGGICWPNGAPASVAAGDAPTIGIHVHQPLLKMVTVVAHEVSHLSADDPSELAARRYERAWLHRIPQTDPEWIAARDGVLAREIALLEQEQDVTV